MRAAERLVKLEVKLKTREQPVWIDLPSWVLPPLDLADGDRCWVAGSWYVGREQSVTIGVWAACGPRPTEDEYEAQLCAAIEKASQQFAGRRVEPLGNTKYTLEARAAVQAAKERVKMAPTIWRRYTSCKTRIEVPVDGSTMRCPSCGKGTS